MATGRVRKSQRLGGLRLTAPPANRRGSGSGFIGPDSLPAALPLLKIHKVFPASGALQGKSLASVKLLRTFHTEKRIPIHVHACWLAQGSHRTKEPTGFDLPVGSFFALSDLCPHLGLVLPGVVVGVGGFHDAVVAPVAAWQIREAGKRFRIRINVALVRRAL